MKITCENNDGKLLIALEGRLNPQTAPELERTLEENLPGASSLTFDLAGLEYISSAGLRVFLKARKTIKKRDAIVLLHVNEDIMEIFEMTGFTEFMKIE